MMADKKLTNYVRGSWTGWPGSLPTPEFGVRMGPLTLERGAVRFLACGLNSVSVRIGVSFHPL